MKEYVLEIVGREICNLSLPGEPPFWTLNFNGTVGAGRAAKEAIRLLQRRGEQLVGGLGLTDFDPSIPAWRYRVRTKPTASESMIA